MTVKKVMVKILLLMGCVFYSLHAEGESIPELDKETQLAEINKSLKSLKKWQGQYRKKQQNYQQRASRLLFKNSTDSKMNRGLAEDAKKNVKVLQDQIDLLNSQKKYLMDTP